MKTELPFRHENEKNSFNKIHPMVRFILPFILVIPCLIIADLYLIITIILIVSIFNFVFRLKFVQTLSRLKLIIPFVFVLTIFVPFYYGSTVLYQFYFLVPIKLYSEGLRMALIIFFRIILAALTFLSFFSSLTYSEYIETLTKIRIIPSFLVGSIVIMLHYIPILARSNKKVLEAQELRGKNTIKYRARLKTHAYIMGKNLVTNMERSEKLYDSLKMRGFSGKISFASEKLRLLDYLVIIIFLLIMVFLVYFIDIDKIVLGVL
jgi:cobalt/nickel transport system permease protein